MVVLQCGSAELLADHAVVAVVDCDNEKLQLELMTVESDLSTLCQALDAFGVPVPPEATGEFAVEPRRGRR